MADDQCNFDIQACGARRYLELLIDKKAAILEGHLGHERELRETQANSLSTALVMQRTENDRRLELLNGEHARVAAAQAMFVSKETFEGSRREEATWRLDIQERIERTAAALPQYVTRETWEAAQQADRIWKNGVSGSLAEAKGASARMVYIVGIAMALLAIGLRFIPGL
jgi:hypothetical protein